MQSTSKSKARFRRIGLALLAGFALQATACTNVAFYEKRAFAEDVMTSEDDPGALHWRQKVHYSREAAIGGMGKTAGGGCGCY